MSHRFDPNPVHASGVEPCFAADAVGVGGNRPTGTPHILAGPRRHLLTRLDRMMFLLLDGHLIRQIARRW